MTVSSRGRPDCENVAIPCALIRRMMVASGTFFRDRESGPTPFSRISSARSSNIGCDCRRVVGSPLVDFAVTRLVRKSVTRAKLRVFPCHPLEIEESRGFWSLGARYVPGVGLTQCGKCERYRFDVPSDSESQEALRRLALVPNEQRESALRSD